MVEHMTRHRFYALSQDEKDAWTLRLHEMGVALNNAVEFWFDGDQVTKATVYKRDAQGRLIVEGNEAARALVVSMAYQPGSVGG